MIAGRRTEREVAQTLRLDRAARGVDELYRAALAAEQEFAAELDAAFPDAVRFGMLTASNPGFAARGDTENRDADRLLQHELERLDLRHRPAVAIAHNRTWKAYNWLVIDPDVDAFDALARRFGQIGTLLWSRNSPVRLRMRAKRPETLMAHPAIDWIGETSGSESVPGEANQASTT